MFEEGSEPGGMTGGGRPVFVSFAIDIPTLLASPFPRLPRLSRPHTSCRTHSTCHSREHACSATGPNQKGLIRCTGLEVWTVGGESGQNASGFSVPLVLLLTETGVAQDGASEGATTAPTTEHEDDNTLGYTGTAAAFS
ncbi:E3 ubiquitin-protein ligase SINAT5 [Dissostichus eleginoides]|uniref:E3 ubiquitin-protein ligase SINAT5 n=1 Tax=Dissostichus eleginoides TaxID=100907 RepID=A0AAD9FFP7_DISEL|nr:E3 ubiquitin-protein ligase SINAT5 [Dissostichus eleginoides]